MVVDIVCGNCGKTIHTMKMLKSIKDTMSPYKSKCTSCGHVLSTAEFGIETKEI